MALVGHEPLLSKLAALLVTGQTNGASFVFKKGAVACIEYPDRPSQPSNLEPGAARMLWLAQPRLLRALAR
jgi:phosphohistidine phosphatase SixA